MNTHEEIIQQYIDGMYTKAEMKIKLSQVIDKWLSDTNQPVNPNQRERIIKRMIQNIIEADITLDQAYEDAQW